MARRCSRRSVRELWLILVIFHAILILFSYSFLNRSCTSKEREFIALNAQPSGTQKPQGVRGDQVYSNPLNILVVFPLLGDTKSTSPSKSNHEKFVVNSWVRLANAVAAGALAPNSSIKLLGMVEELQQCYAEFQAISYASHYSCKPALKECLHPEYQIPTMDCILQYATQLASPSEIVLYTNSDIIFSIDGIRAISALISGFGAADRSKFLITGRRTEIPVEAIPTQYSDKAHDQLIKYAHQNGTLYSPYGMDYFIFPPSAFPRDFPRFLLGRWRWDNALLSHFIVNNIPTGLS